MKLMNLCLVAAALTISVSACSHAPTRMNDESANATATPPSDEGYPDAGLKRDKPVVTAAAPAPVVIPAVRDEGTSSGTTTSLGASSSGRGH